MHEGDDDDHDGDDDDDDDGGSRESLLFGPPPWPQFGQLGPLFWMSKPTFCAYDQNFFDDDNDGFNDNCDVNFGNFDDNPDKND